MRAMRGRWMKTGAALILVLGFAGLSATVSAAGAATQVIDARDLVSRLQRLERDMRDLQAETFRRAPGAPGAAEPNAAPVPPPPADQVAMPDLNPMMRRMDQLEESIGRLTGQMEELGHSLDQITQKTDRLQKQLDLQAAQAGAAPAVAATTAPDAAGPTADMPAAPDAGALASLTPEQNAPVLRGAPPANLGQIPAGASLPSANATPADPKGEFDAAMNLLSRAQYDPAKDAFRKFADAHPDDDRAADALYWTGDIAYSAKRDYPEAARDFAELLKKYPKAQRAPEGMLKLGLALFELGQTKEGCAALAALPAKYPEASQGVATRARTERTSNKCR